MTRSLSFATWCYLRVRARGSQLCHPAITTVVTASHMRMLLGLTEALPSLVEAKFQAAKASSSLLFAPSELAIIRTSTGIPVSSHTTWRYTKLIYIQFQLRYCPSLAKKPTAQKPETTPKQKIDPFENPPPALHLVDIPTANPSHLLVLNKFPIIAKHFIVATKSNKRQTHALEQDDLEATYACLKSWEEGQDGKRLYAFFNSGEQSGASQPHRHLQFLPLEGMRDGGATSGWDLLIDLILLGKSIKTGNKLSKRMRRQRG